MLQLPAAGLSSKEVAEHLGVPVVMVRADLGSILAKLGAGSRLEALIVAIRHGLIDVPPG